MNLEKLIESDRRFVWHPYSSARDKCPVYPVDSAEGVHLRLQDGRTLIDGMSSWWSAIHGYGHPVMIEALERQLRQLPHVMFGGLTHAPAVELAEKLVRLTPAPLESVFFSDSGSVSVEVAMKMAVQFWLACGKEGKTKFLTIRKGYHGDTFGAMSVCDPVSGMHSMYGDAIQPQLFADPPQSTFGEPCPESDIASLSEILEREHGTVAAVILEPVVQGAGGMRFYSAEYLSHARSLCDRHGVLLIFDEIATGFGRTGRMFASEHAGIAPDIMCLGKALTGGYLSLAATLCSEHVSTTISGGSPGKLMHGPTFMGNPLACTAGLASLDILLGSPWESMVASVERGLRQGLEPCGRYSWVKDVRTLGAIGVVELNKAVDLETVQPLFVDRGAWVRPFGNLIYLMPPYIIQDKDLAHLTTAVCEVVSLLGEHN